MSGIHSNLQDENSIQLLQLIHHLSRGKTNEIISKKNLGKSIGLSQQQTDRAMSILVKEGMVKPIIFNALCITHIGILEAERNAPPISEDQPAGRPAPSHKKIPILFLSADPSDLARLRSGEEAREIHEQLQQASQRDRFELHQRTSVRPEDISQALLDVRPEIVHFSGHSTSTGAICVEGPSGWALPIEPIALGMLFEQFAETVRCVVLNACYSEAQANAIVKYVEYVAGMSQAIGDKAAIAFAVGFYQALGAGRCIEDAYALGCVQIRLQGIPENLTPVLKKRST